MALKIWFEKYVFKIFFFFFKNTKVFKKHKIRKLHIYVFMLILQACYEFIVISIYYLLFINFLISQELKYILSLVHNKIHLNISYL